MRNEPFVLLFLNPPSAKLVLLGFTGLVIHLNWRSIEKTTYAGDYTSCNIVISILSKFRPKDNYEHEEQ